MASHEWIERGGKRILYLNIASKNIEELEGKLKEFRAVIDEQPLHSLLAITDTKNGHFDVDMIKIINSFVEDNTPFVQSSVVIGLDGLKRIMYEGMLRVTGRKNMTTKSTLDEAIDCLISQ
jgi:hypothetical protein